ncbi:MAG: lysoplasmalogenase [Chloroflexota bacterium]|nr:lysoplasmalogenase [Chloroflexota bacterium]MBI5703085.1 lysoplasmalogenase [Chloroflexota bacterium]
MNLWLILAFVFAVLQIIVLWKELGKLEYVTKPAVMIFLFAWLYSSTGLQGLTFWFGLGVLFSLAGDVFLMFSHERWFLYGLAAFLFAHFSYLAGFQNELRQFGFWQAILLAILSVGGVRVMRRLIPSIRAGGRDRLVAPVVLYAAVITAMLYAALTTLSNPAWKAGASLLVGVGAFLFYLSDIVLAWNRFVAPIKNGRIINIALYHLGQISLIAGVIGQFG